MSGATLQTAAELMRRYVRSHNEGVRTGDFRALLALFHPHATLAFVGIPVGPFAGLDAIFTAFQTNPPSGAVRLSGRIDEESGRARAAYAWDDRPSIRAGSFELVSTDGRIASLVITVSPER